MSHKLLQVFKHAEGQGFVNGRKIIEEFRQRSAMFQIVEQRPNRYTCAYENWRPPRECRDPNARRESCRPWLNLFDSALPSTSVIPRLSVWCGERPRFSRGGS
jgi:hypothetical protein